MSGLGISFHSFVYSFIVLGLGLQASQVLAAKPLHMLEELAESAPQKEYSEIVRSIVRADLVSVGETHEKGLEREVLARFYEDLARNGLTVEKCLVEVYQHILPNTPDHAEVREQFGKICPESKVYDSQIHDYSEPLDKYFREFKDKKLLTHTGSRHMYPHAQFYPRDFTRDVFPWIDESPIGTISAQVPRSFVRAGKKQASFSVLPVHKLVAHAIQADLRKKVTDFSKLLLAIDSLQQRFGADNALYFELPKVQKKFKYHTAYLALIDHKVTNSKTVAKLLQSPELKKYLSMVKTNSLRVYSFVNMFDSTLNAGGLQITSPMFLFVRATSNKNKNEERIIGIEYDGTIRETSYDVGNAAKLSALAAIE